jgi:hypothetical protein
MEETILAGERNSKVWNLPIRKKENIADKKTVMKKKERGDALD